MPLLT
jgi:hypothetical protein